MREPLNEDNLPDWTPLNHFVRWLTDGTRMLTLDQQRITDDWPDVEDDKYFAAQKFALISLEAGEMRSRCFCQLDKFNRTYGGGWMESPYEQLIKETISTLEQNADAPALKYVPYGVWHFENVDWSDGTVFVKIENNSLWFRDIEISVEDFLATTGRTNESLESRERESLLKLVYGMASALGYDPAAKRSPTPSKIRHALNSNGLDMDPKTIRRWLKEASSFLKSETGIDRE